MSDFKSNTPVVLLVFKRPEQTAKVFEVVRQVKPPKLLVVADGPRPDKPGEAEKCAATRAIIDRVDWDCEVLTNFSEVNLGCKQRVSSGLTWAFEIVEEAIIIEDDCVPEASFFRYCEELLERYRDEPRVMSITGENTHGYQANDSSYYFSQYGFYWGWATWKRAWKMFDGDLQLWAGLKETNWLENLLQNPDATEYWADIFDSTYDGFNSWGYGWTFACFVNQGLCAVANNNLISNIGFGVDAAHHTWSADEIGNLPVAPLQFPLQNPLKIAKDEAGDLEIDKIRFSGRQKYRIARKLAVRYLNTQEYKQSLNWFGKALELRPDLVGVNYGKAVCLARMGDKTKAISTLTSLLKADSKYPKAKVLLDELMGFSMGEPLLDEIVTLEDIIWEAETPPTATQAKTTSATATNKAEEIKQVESPTPQTSTNAQAKGSAIAAEAVKSLNAQGYKKSLDWFDRALELRPDLVGVSYGKAVCLARMGDKAKAISNLTSLLKADSKHPKAKVLLDELMGFSMGEPLLDEIVTLKDILLEVETPPTATQAKTAPETNANKAEEIKQVESPRIDSHSSKWFGDR